MTPLEIGLTLFITLLGGGILFWMIQVDTHFRRYSRDAVAEREVQSARVSLLVDEISRLSDDCTALLHTQPRLHGLITAHTPITRLEQSLEAGGSPAGPGRSGSIQRLSQDRSPPIPVR